MIFWIWKLFAVATRMAEIKKIGNWASKTKPNRKPCVQLLNLPFNPTPPEWQPESKKSYITPPYPLEWQPESKKSYITSPYPTRMAAREKKVLYHSTLSSRMAARERKSSNHSTLRSQRLQQRPLENSLLISHYGPINPERGGRAWDCTA